MTKASAVAPSNIAFTKYWGKKDEVLRLPENGSISMCLSDLLTHTSVDFSDKYKKDNIEINGEVEAGEESRVVKHLDRIRSMAGVSEFAKVVSKNNFPAGTGLSSSASGFAALSLAGAIAAGLELSEKELSILARQGSGSACRSIPSGFVEWIDGNSNETSYAKSIFPADYWKIADVVAVVSQGKKEISTTTGMKSVTSSPFREARLSRMEAKNCDVKKYIQARDFTALGELAESEALELHAIMLTQNPPLIYLLPNTILLMRSVQSYRKQGLECYFTINTGQDVHILVEQKNVNRLKGKLQSVRQVQKVIVSTPSEGVRQIDRHLF